MANGGYDLNLLIPLRALLEEANVTRAGQRVRLGQSSMSSALSRLRVAFNDELLVRVGRDYELTPFARLLLPQVQATVPLIERVLTGERLPEPTTARRAFTIMVTDYGVMRLRPALAAVLADAPLMQVDLMPLPERPMESERDLITHDFVITVPGTGIDGPHLPLLEDEYVCLVDAANPALHDGALSFEDFLALPQAVARFGRLHYTPADRRLRELGVDRREPRVTTSSFLPLPSVVAGTDLVAVVPRALAEVLGPPTGTIGVPAPFGSVPIALNLWWHESHDADPAHRWFRERLAAALHADLAATASPVERTTAPPEG
ncbi:LysR family transcriptional regulator [Microbacterium oryzae]|uniref:LysR family transcriptional regulator n=1 Tax=Microbacterium oryzae TaxID=743009 RepID=UPI0025B26E09|nr:LysR family transcriptional regulator [Microbacterium oryzae]MDN3310216.1 LysR family transcriptional regulator [Microbacterium oryzae]